MPFNQISVVSPHSEQTQKKEKKSDLEKIMDGLSVANGILGIGVNIQSIRAHQAQIEGAEQSQGLAAVDAMDKATDRSNAIVGRFNKPQQAEFSKNFAPAAAGQKADFTGIDSATEGPLSYVKRTKAPVVKPPVGVQTMEDGKPVTKFVTPKEGDTYIKPPTKASGSGAGTTRQVGNEIVQKQPDGSWAPVYTKDTSGKDAAADEKLGRELAYKINPSLGRAGELGRTQARINAASRALTLGLHEDGTVRNLTKSEIGELASSVASMVANGSVAGQHAIDSMTPSSLWGNLQAQEAYLTNDVKEADMQPFVQRLVDTAKREQQTSMKAKTEAQAQVIPAFHDWRERNPEAWARTVKAAGLNPDDFDQDSNYAPKAKEPGAAPSVAGASAKSPAGVGPPSGGNGTANAAPATPPPPTPGDIVDGHVFIGGNPADPKSWRATGAPLKGAK